MHLADDTPLSRYNILQCLYVVGIIACAHSHISVTTHSDGYDVLIILRLLNALCEEFLDAFRIPGIIPWANLIATLGIFLMGTHHWLVVGSAHHYTHFICYLRTERVILVECRSPHGRPEIVGLQAQ